jgi:hypothetical protein
MAVESIKPGDRTVTVQLARIPTIPGSAPNDYILRLFQSPVNHPKE